MSEAQKFVGLPLVVVGPIDIGRLLRELEALDNAMLQLTLQKQELKLPKTTMMMDELIILNKLNLLDKADRVRLQQFLTAIKEKAPLLHISFSADPSTAFVEKMMDWLRRNIHPLALMTVGLQPNIGAGCILRTDNKYFDFSLAQNFTKNRELLMSKLRAPIGAPTPVQPVSTEPTEVPA